LLLLRDGRGAGKDDSEVKRAPSAGRHEIISLLIYTMTKNAYENSCKEVDKLKRKAAKINKTLVHVMVVIMTRIKPRKNK